MTNSRPISSRKNWKKRIGGIDLELPSGNVCLVRRPGMESLLKEGIMPDSLTPIAMKHIAKAESGGKPLGKEEEDDIQKELMAQVMDDPSKIANMMLVFDRVTAKCVVEPKVVLHVTQRFNPDGSPVLENGDKVWDEIPYDQRLSDEVDELNEDGDPNPLYSADPPMYTDEIDGNDKSFIFQYVVGGDSDLEKFRRESGATLEDA